MIGTVACVTHGEPTGTKEPPGESRKASWVGLWEVGAIHSSDGVRGNSDHSVGNRSVGSSAPMVKGS